MGCSCLLWEHGADQLLILGTLGHVQGVQLLSEYIGAESTVSTQGQGSSCSQWVHGGRGSSCLQWVHGGQGVQLLTVGTCGQGGQLLTVGTWGKGAWVHGGGV